MLLDIYFKPTDTCRCLPFSSSHPSHCKENIPFTLALRICTIEKNRQPKLKHLSNLGENLKNYNYSSETISNAIRKTLPIPPKEIRKPKIKEAAVVLAFISMFNPNNPPVFNTIKRHLRYLKEMKFQIESVSHPISKNY